MGSTLTDDEPYEAISSAEFEALDWGIRAPMRMIEAWSLKNLDPRDTRNIGEALLKLADARAALRRAHQAALEEPKS